MALNSKNYFSKSNQMKYMGSSQFKDFLKCPAMAMAKLKGEYQEEKSVALLVGSYVDAYFEGTLEQFKIDNPEIFTAKGELKSDYKKADEIIARIESDPIMMKYLGGKKQVIKWGKIEGVLVKIKIDSYFKGKAIIDQKIMKDMKPVWNDETRIKENFVEAWGYDIQGVIYQEIEGKKLAFVLAVATKEKVTDLALLEIPQDRLDIVMETLVRPNIKKFDNMKKGLEPITSCGVCDYCISKKKLTGIIDYRNIK